MSPTCKILCALFTFMVLFSISGLLGVGLGWLMRPKAPAFFVGWQPVPRGRPFALYNLTRAIPGHPAGSTVSALTLENAGFRVPRPRILPPREAHA